MEKFGKTWAVIVLCYGVLSNMFHFFFYVCHEWRQIWQNFESQKCGELKYYEKLKSLLCYQF